MALINKLSAIGDAIREKTGKEDLLTLEQMPEEIRGIETGGGDSYYDTFWDNYQNNGELKSYAHAFRGTGWNDETFKPKYTIKTSNAESMFQNSLITELPAGIVDWSNCGGYASSAFQYCSNLKIIHEPIITTKMTRFNNMFYGCNLLETVSFEGTKAVGNWSSTFVQCANLKNVRFINVELYGDIPPAFASCPLLTNESVQSIIDALKDLTGATTKTITFHADVKAKLTDTQIATITNKNWTLA